MDETIVFTGPRAEKFWARLDRTNPDACWTWPGATDAFGYGKVVVQLRQFRTHRVAYALVNGPIPPNMCICHSCDQPPCCNPAHLWLGTHADNMRDRGNKGRGREHRQWGADNPRAVLTTADVAEIRRLVRAGRTQVSVAASSGFVSHTSAASSVGQVGADPREE